MFLGSGKRPVPRDRDPTSLKYLGPPTYARTVWHRVTKFRVVTHMGDMGQECVSWGLAMPPWQRGPSVPQNFGTPLRPTWFDIRATTWGRSVFLEGRPRHELKGRDPSIPKLFWDPCAQTIWPTAIKFDVINMRSSSVFLGHPHPILMRGPTRPPNLGPFTYARTHVRNNQILHCYQSRWVTFYTVDHECWRAICLR